MYVVYICGGEGTRLRPLTYTVPKPMLPIGSKPVLEISILRAREQGFKKFILLVNYKAEIIKSYFGNGESLDVEIQYYTESERRGTAGPLSALHDKISDSFVAMNADILTEINFKKLLEFHKKKQSDLTVALKEINIPIPYGVVSLDNTERIQNIQEKPNYDLLINSGIYCISSKTLDIIPLNGVYSMTQFIDDAKQNGKRILGFRFSDYWKDIGRMDDYLRVIQDSKENDTPDWLKALH